MDVSYGGGVRPSQRKMQIARGRPQGGSCGDRSAGELTVQA